MYRNCTVHKYDIKITDLIEAYSVNLKTKHQLNE